MSNINIIPYQNNIYTENIIKMKVKCVIFQTLYILYLHFKSTLQ